MTTRPRSHRHLAAQQKISGHHIAVCGQYRIGIRLTDNRDDVDCAHCLNSIRPDRPHIYSSTAIYRATKRLKEIYAAEFEELYEEELARERQQKAK